MPSQQDSSPPRRSWRRLLRSWHRDLGYLCAALTVAYTISGIAVNHRADWDYNRSTSSIRVLLGGPAKLLPELGSERRAVLELEPASLTSREEEELAQAIGAELGVSTPPHNTFWRSRYALAVHFSAGDADQVDYDVRSGVAVRTQRTERPLLRHLNFLHLNEARQWWTYLADGYAGALLFLAASGILMIRGRRGLWGRGGFLAGVGLIIPALAILWFRYR